MSKYLYTVTNRPSANAVVGMKILDDGQLELLPGSPFATGGQGSRSSQSQNGVWIHKKLLFAVDFGSESFAIFRKAADGSLTRLHDDPLPSHGKSPCSLCVNKGLLYVVNQHQRSSGGRAEPNFSVFRLNGDTVEHLPDSGFAFRRGESPTQVIANPQGSVLAIPSVRTRRSLLHCYHVHQDAAGTAEHLVEFDNSPFEITETGYGFGSVWHSDGERFYMTNAIGDGSVVILNVDRKASKIEEVDRFTTPGNACWAALSADDSRLYVANLLSLIVFDTTGDKLTQLQSLDVDDIDNPVIRDLALTPDGRFLYAIEQRQRRILIYKVGDGGLVTRHGELAYNTRGFTLGLAIG
jgi:hypothetical protein